MRDSKGRFIKGGTPHNKGVKGSTGDHRGEKNSYHKLTDEQKQNLAQTGNIAANLKIAGDPELYADKKRASMQKAFDRGYRLSPEAGWGTSKEYTGKELDINHISINKLLGI